MRKAFLLGLVALVGWSSCSTDFDVAGEYREMAVVYGLLDVDADTQFIRIQRSFLGELSAEAMALNPDSSYFGVNAIMSLNEYDDNGTQTNSMLLDTVSVYGKEEGVDGEFNFFAPKQRLYYTTEPLDAAREYELLIVNPTTGYRDSTAVGITGDRVKVLRTNSFKFNNPSENGIFNSKRVDMFLDGGIGYRDYVIRFNHIPEAFIYEVWLHFDYVEERTANGVTTSTPKTLSWLVQRSSYDEEQQQPPSEIAAPFNGEAWYQFVGNSLQSETGLVRRIGTADIPEDLDNFAQAFRIEVIAGGKELRDYLEINAPSNSGALTDKPAFSTMAVGRGFISTRTFQWHPGTIHLGGASIDHLMGGQYTSDLGFGEH